jgi:ABC-type transport system involved in multi-copper enzyme maturation permease subunit
MSAVMVIARLSWLRLRRGRNKWMSIILAALPPFLAGLVAVVSQDPGSQMWTFSANMLLQFAAPLAAAAHLASAVGEELEQKTFSYLWSRPPPRWTLLAGKLVAHVPALTAMFAVSSALVWGISVAAGVDLGPTELLRLIAGSTGAVVAGSCLAVGAGAIFPKYPLAFVLGFGMVLDKLLMLIPAVQPLSASLSATGLAGLPFPETQVPSWEDALIRLAVNGAIWLAIGVWRVSDSEYALPDA